MRVIRRRASTESLTPLLDELVHYIRQVERLSALYRWILGERLQVSGPVSFILCLPTLPKRGSTGMIQLAATHTNFCEQLESLLKGLPSADQPDLETTLRWHARVCNAIKCQCDAYLDVWPANSPEFWRKPNSPHESRRL